MGQCVNSKHPEVVVMAGELNAHPAVIAAQIGIWQEKNNIYDRFPTVEEVNKSKIQDDIAIKLENDSNFRISLDALISKGATYNDYIEHRNSSFLELGSVEDFEHFENKYNDLNIFDNTKIDSATEQEYSSYSKVGSLEEFNLFKQSPLYIQGRVKKGVQLANFKRFISHQKYNVEAGVERLLSKLGQPSGQKVSGTETDYFSVKSTKILSASEMFLNGESSQKIGDILIRLSESNIFNTLESTSEILKRLIILSKGSNVKLKLASTANELKLTKDNLMVYDRYTNSILISQEVLDNNSIPYLASVLLHEMVHAHTVNKLIQPQTAKEKEFSKFMNSAYEQFKALALAKDENGKLAYGFKDVYEFTAELYSNPEFANEIKSLDKPWFTKFIDWVSTILGFKGLTKGSEFISSTVLLNTLKTELESGNNNLNITVGKQYFNMEQPPKDKFTERLIKLKDAQLNNLDQILKRSRANLKKGVKTTDFIDATQKIYDSLNSAKDLDILIGVSTYVDFMSSQLDVTRKLLNKVKDSDAEYDLELLKRLDSYIAANNLTDLIRKTLTDVRVNEMSTKDQNIAHDALNKLDAISGTQKTLMARIENIRKDLLKKELSKPYYVNKAVEKFKNKIRPLYPKDSPLSKEQWVNKQIIERAEEVDRFVNNEIEDLLENATEDISAWDSKVYSTIKTQSPLLQLVQSVISKMKALIDKQVNAYDFELSDLYNKYTKDGGYNPSESVVKDKKGVLMLKGEYSIEVFNHFKYDVPEAYDKARMIKEKLEKQGLSGLQIAYNKDYLAARTRARDLKFKYTITNSENVRIIDPKYKNKLNAKEKMLYDAFYKVAKEGESVFGKYNSLIDNFYNADFVNLPYKEMTNLERISTGKLNVGETLKQKKTSLFSWRPDEVDQYYSTYDVLGEKIFNIPVLFRNNLNKDSKEYQESIKYQSSDLFTLLRIEKYNVINFREKSKNETVLNGLLSVTREKTFLKTERGSLIKNIFGKHVSTVPLEGSKTNTYTRMQEVVQQSLYNVFREQGMKIGNTDVNKIVQNVNKHTSFLGMTMNYFNAPVNVLNGEMQMIISRISGELDSNVLRAAHAEYVKDLPNIINDLGKNVKESKMNQLNLLLDMFGGLSHGQKDFLVNSIFKDVADPHTLQILQEGGEHMLHSVLAVAVAKTIKVYDGKGNIVDKNGVVTKDSKKGASLYDMLKFEGKQLQFDTSKFKYTDKSMGVDFETEGIAAVRLYTKNIIENLYGQYDINFANGLQRHWWGQLFIMYKKYVIPMGLNRFRGGLGSAFGKLDKELHYNSAAQSYEEGFYISSLKVLRKMFGTSDKGLAGILEKFKFSIMQQNWNELSDLEKMNVRKMMTELGILTLLTTVIVPMLAALAGNGDDDDIAWFYAMTARRLEQELWQFIDPREAYNLTENPVAALNIIETYINAVKFGATPWTWGSQTSTGEYRALNTLEKLTIPSAWRSGKNAKDIYKNSVRNAYVPQSEGLAYELFDAE